MLKNARKRSGKRPEVRRNFVRLRSQLFKFDGNRVRITIGPKRYVYLDLVLGEYQRKFVEAWKRGELKIDEIIVKEDCAYTLISDGLQSSCYTEDKNADRHLDPGKICCPMSRQ